MCFSPLCNAKAIGKHDRDPSKGVSHLLHHYMDHLGEEAKLQKEANDRSRSRVKLMRQRVRQTRLKKRQERLM